MREKRRRKKMIIDGEAKAKKKHMLHGQVGTTERIPLLP
jgi:hypothetical protein